ncbi:amino acid ABC transporter substrate-binding protein, PAAT family [Bradyrhizobium sp. Ghvi]|uniref:transporter substrate-binding domain-containing protein n=1 Tax=Bradyrhizobium sp. Ghvi TaxID=1855319 RepID=UPI0008E7F6DA|nr:transporter substrate-binding domain-containing protein [Bradyrhizobium sp. Ghvi]SFQ24962.1 amino acid ABC transporter substrate-binding protein, PAAT family [Bradyrhizobium sp. Ghvi]
MNRLARMLPVAVSLAAALAALPANAGAVLDRVLATKTLKVAAGVDWPPASFMNDKGQLDGYDVDVVKGIAKYLGVQVQFVTPGWDVVAAAKWEGRWDMALGQITPTKARAEKLSFPVIYIYGQSVAVVHKDSKANQLSDLDGKTVGVTANTTQEAYTNRNLTPDWLGGRPVEFQLKPGKVKTYESTNIALDDLRLGDGVRLDAVVAPAPIVGRAIKSGYPIKRLGGVLFSAPASFATLHGDKEFDDKIAAAVKSMKDDGSLSELSLKWYGADYTVAN